MNESLAISPTTNSPVAPAATTALRSWHWAKKGVLAVGLRGAAAAIALGVQICLARLLGQTEFGAFAYAFAWMQILLIFARGGLDTTALRFVAEYRARGEWGLMHGFLRWATRLALLESVLFGLGLAVVSLLCAGWTSGSTLINFLIVAVTIPVFSQSLFCSAAVRGLGEVTWSMLADLIRPVALLGFLLGLAALSVGPITATTALLWQLVATSLGLTVMWFLQRKLERRFHPELPGEVRQQEWMSTSLHCVGAMGLAYLQGRTGVVVAGLFLSQDSAGTYAAIERLAEAMLLGMASINMISAPVFASLHAQGKRDELQRMARLAAWGATGFMLVGLLMMALFGKPILGLFGKEFVPAYWPLMILLGGTAINAMCGSVDFLLTMTGHHRSLAPIFAGSLFVNLGLCLLLLPRYDVLGLAIANAAAVVFWNVSMLVVVRRRLGLWPNIGRLSAKTLL
ncbi:lipopolysaccharide biosynthesis protein [Planctomicrobium sp. SH664]|uniref:lipopolysaccharide biosynthesis protein n=1 Tax=Planctomicrobium sp. SH664 TaxID=3448125 RepID=UPI003F5C9558